MLRGYKYRLYPTKQQTLLLDKHFGACRFVYNLALETKKWIYHSYKINLSAYDLINQLPELKKEAVWLNDVSSQSLQQSIINMDGAFKKFYKGLADFPKFKSKHSHQSFINPHGSKVKFIDNNTKIAFPKFTEGIKFVQDRQFTGVIKSNVISKTPTGKYYISILVNTSDSIPELPSAINKDKTLGIDLGLSHFIITSDGIKVDNPKHLKNALKKLKYLSRQLSKKKKGSKNRIKAKQRVAIQHEKISNHRKDFLHKVSSKLVSDNQALCFEKLQISNMMGNHKLAQSIGDVGWATFISMCKYKLMWQGKHFIQMPTFEPSTKICNICSNKNNDLTLVDRKWECSNCKTMHDRDINAAINIKNYCLQNFIKEKMQKSKDLGGGLHREKLVELPTLVGAVKQEVYL